MGRFGVQLKMLREAKGITQEQLGEVVCKKKMTISLIENGKNDPPQGEFLEKIISALALTEEEEYGLRDLAALARGAIPSDLLSYFRENEEVRAAIRRAKAQGRTGTDWKSIFGGKAT
ncbi:MAG: helix-turn-helix transcriptional regulator [Ethanoligenens sp.]